MQLKRFWLFSWDHGQHWPATSFELTYRRGRWQRRRRPPHPSRRCGLPSAPWRRQLLSPAGPPLAPISRQGRRWGCAPGRKHVTVRICGLWHRKDQVPGLWHGRGPAQTESFVSVESGAGISRRTALDGQRCIARPLARVELSLVRRRQCRGCIGRRGAAWPSWRCVAQCGPACMPSRRSSPSNNRAALRYQPS